MYAFDQCYALACVCRTIVCCKMYSYVAPSRPVFYVLLCYVSDLSQDKIALGVTDSRTTVHCHLHEDTACIQLLRRPAQHSAAID
jgi:hypothetical protein